MASLSEILEAAERLREILTWHLAAPLVDHDGGDEDDQLVEARAFLRAAIKPRSRWVRHGDRLIVVQEPELKPMAIRFHDPGDEDRP